MPSFLSGITDSTFLDLVSEYGAGGQSITRGTFGGMITITPSVGHDGASIDEVNDIQPELLAQISATNLPAPDPDTLYVLMFRKGQLITQGGFDSKHDFCAFHGAIPYDSSTNLRYAVLPYDASDLDPLIPGQKGCGSTAGMSNYTSVMSHELIESITDPDVSLAFGFLPPLSWYDPNNGEVADICNHQEAKIKFADLLKYTVQKVWSNQQHKCVAAGPPRSVSVGDSAVAEGDGGTRTLQVPITLSAGSSTPLSVDYTVAGAGANPATAGVDFDDAGGTGTLAFPLVTKKSTAVTQYVSIPITPDVDVESDETIELTITGVTDGYGITAIPGPEPSSMTMSARARRLPSET